MRNIFLFTMLIISQTAFAQKPCTVDPIYRQFDFWIGSWEAYGPGGKKSGDSKISVILDSCIILEEWTSVQPYKGVFYAGKSFNSYNAQTKQWRQTWVDNAGGSTEYLTGKFENNAMVFLSTPFKFKADTIAIRKLSFFNLGDDKVRQFGEISKDNGVTWAPEFDLEYRRKK